MKVAHLEMNKNQIQMQILSDKIKDKGISSLGRQYVHLHAWIYSNEGNTVYDLQSVSECFQQFVWEE